MGSLPQKSLVCLVADADNPAQVLELLDSYMRMARTHKKQFALPEQHGFLQPVLDTLRSDEALRAFACLVRDDLAEVCGEHSFQYQSTQEFARKIASRIAAQKRRSRLQPALEWAKINMPERTVEERRRWLVRLEQAWAEERRQWLRRAKKSKGAPLTVDEKIATLDAFWESLDDAVALGEFPSWDDLMEG